VFIPKPGSSELRPLSIPAVRDRIVQAAAKMVLEPIFDADMAENRCARWCGTRTALCCSAAGQLIDDHI